MPSALSPQPVPPVLTGVQDLLERAATLSLDDERVYGFANRARVLADSSGDAAGRLQSCLLLGDHHLAKGEYDEVVGSLAPLLTLPLEPSSQVRARLLLSLTEAYYCLEDIANVLRYGAEALKLYQAQGDVRVQARLHEYLGDGYIRFSAYHEALEHYLKQLELLNSQGATLAEPYAGIGWIHCQLGDFKNALAFLEEGLTRARAENNEVVAGRCLGNMGNVYDSMKNHAKALDYHRQAIDVFEARGDFRRAMIGYGNVGKTYFDMGDTAKALAYYDKTLVQLERTPNQAFEGWVFVQVGETLLETDGARAESYLFDGLAKLTEAGSNEGTEQAHHLLFKLYDQRGDAGKALEHYKSYAEFQIKRLKDANEKRTQALSIQFEVEHLQQEQEIYRLKNVELARAVAQLEELSSKDSLTGLYNRRYMDNHLAGAFTDAYTSQQPLTVLISDIDNFKHINDRFSHATGDEVIKAVARIFADNVWGADIVARYGGEEYVAVFKNTDLQQARQVAEKLRRKVAACDWSSFHPDLAVTVSIGLCDEVALGHHEKMLAAADAKLYEVKRAGKNGVRG